MPEVISADVQQSASGELSAPSQVKWRLFGLPMGRPQYLAATLLGMFLAQCLWYAARAPLSRLELAYIIQGRSQLAGGPPNPSPVHSPLPALLGAALSPSAEATAVYTSSRPAFRSVPSRWRVRLPFLLAGVMLGASLWYVSRRLFGNVGGYTALSLYAFAPVLWERAGSVQPVILAAWGAFGVIFTSMAVAHTLYAPREVVLWNWRRIVLLGISVAFALGSQFGLAWLMPVAAGFLLYLAPERRKAALVILAAGCALAFSILAATYSFNFAAMASSTARADLLYFTPARLFSPLTYSLLLLFLLRTPGLMVLLMVSLVTFVAWRRTRFFGTSAPLIVFLLLLAMAVAMPSQGGATLLIVALPFSFVFVAGVFADLLESRAAPVAFGVLLAALIGQAAVSLADLTRF
ncbi:MAG: hypothetical protein AB7O65_05170 [Candidatus Korobacteraceae bacterium]